MRMTKSNYIEMTLLNRRTMYYGQLLENFAYGKEIRLNNLGEWLLEREKTHWSESYGTYKKATPFG